MSLGMHVDIKEIWFGIANGQISLIFDKLSACNTSEISFTNNNLSKYQWIFTKLGMCIDIVQSCLEFLMGNFR